MTSTRIFDSGNFIQPSTGEPIRSVVTESPDAVAVMWHVLPGQTIRPHVHPAGQDTWIILSGKGEYILDENQSTRQITPGQIVVAQAGQVHGVINHGSEPLQFVSVVSPASAGFQLME